MLLSTLDFGPKLIKSKVSFHLESCVSLQTCGLLSPVVWKESAKVDSQVFLFTKIHSPFLFGLNSEFSSM